MNVNAREGAIDRSNASRRLRNGDSGIRSIACYIYACINGNSSCCGILCIKYLADITTDKLHTLNNDRCTCDIDLLIACTNNDLSALTSRNYLGGLASASSSSGKSSIGLASTELDGSSSSINCIRVSSWGGRRNY